MSSAATSGGGGGGGGGPAAATAAATASHATTSSSSRTHRAPRGPRQLGRGAEPLSELQPANADLHQNPENLHPPLPPRRRTAAPAGDAAGRSRGRRRGSGGGAGEDGSSSDADTHGEGDADAEATTAAEERMPEQEALLSNQAFQFVLNEAQQQQDRGDDRGQATPGGGARGGGERESASGSTDGHGVEADPEHVVDEYLAQQARAQQRRRDSLALAHETGAVDDEIYNEEGGYDTDDAERIDELMGENFESRQERELKRMLRLAEKRRRLKQKQERNKNHRGDLVRPYNMGAVRRRLAGFSGIDALKSTHQRARFRAFRTLRPHQSFKYDKDGNMVRQSRVAYSNGVVYEGDLFEGKRHGRGVMTDANGSRHVGEFRSGEKHGFGVCEYGELQVPDKDAPSGFRLVKGQKYEGQFVKGKRCGDGVQWCGNGTGDPPFDLYKGDFEDDLFHGEGTLTRTNGEVYSGNWRRGLRHGHGETTNLGGRTGDSYTGHYLRGLHHGQGTLDNGQRGRYSGMWHLGLKHGAGRSDYSDGGFFVGIYKENVYHRGKLRTGNGDEYDGTFDEHGRYSGNKCRMRFANGDTYEGGWKRGFPWGYGRLEYHGGGYYEGDFRKLTPENRYQRLDSYGEPVGHTERFPHPDGERHGFGRRVYQNGNQYEGDWAEDRRHGFGTLKLVDGPAEYAGAFVRGHRTGEGVLVHGDRRKDPARWYRYDGSFRNGVLEGRGRLVMGDGRSYEGDFRAGVRHGYGTQVLCPDAQRGDPRLMYVGGGSGSSSLYRPQKYTGAWYQGKPWGRGVLWYPDGARVQGSFEAGHPHGVCTVVWPSGRPINAFFRHGVLEEFIDVPEESQLWCRRAERMRVALQPARDPVFPERDLRPAEPADSFGSPLFGDGPDQLPHPPREAFEIGGAANSDYGRELREREAAARVEVEKKASFQRQKKEAALRMALGFLDKGADYCSDDAFVHINGVLL